MAINNEPRWVELNTVGETTGESYFGRFSVKPYLQHNERADAVRLAERYCRGIDTAQTQRMFLTTLAFLKFHVLETDAEWWQEDGLSLLDEEPIYKLAELLGEIQKPKGKADDKPRDEAEKDPKGNT